MWNCESEVLVVPMCRASCSSNFAKPLLVGCSKCDNTTSFSLQHTQSISTQVQMERHIFTTSLASYNCLLNDYFVTDTSSHVDTCHF